LYCIYRITAVMKARKEIFASVTFPIGRDVILVIMYAETFNIDIIFTCNVIM